MAEAKGQEWMGPQQGRTRGTLAQEGEKSGHLAETSGMTTGMSWTLSNMPSQPAPDALTEPQRGHKSHLRSFGWGSVQSVLGTPEQVDE